MLTLPPGSTGRSSAAIVGWALVLGLVAVLTVVSGVSSGLRDRHPESALRFLPTDALAWAKLADKTLLVTDPRSADMADARIDAREALSRDAVLPTAWRTLALTAPESSSNYLRLLQFAQQLSRRDVATQLALLEIQVGRGNIMGALRHYDIILRISSTYDATLFPVLAAASAEPQIQQALAGRLIHAPMWRRRFLSYMANSNTPMDVQADLFSAMSRQGPLADRDIAAVQATNSALAGQFEVAERLYRLLEPDEAVKAFRNGGFEKDGGIAPFDWQLDVAGPLNVGVNASGENKRLEMTSDRGDGARGARQLMTLEPGRHRVIASFGAVEEAAAGVPYINLLCADTPRRSPVSMVYGTGDSADHSACRRIALGNGWNSDFVRTPTVRGHPPGSIRS